VAQAPGQRAVEAHLERPDRVDRPWPDEEEEGGGGQGQPGAHPCSEHHDPEEDGGDEVREHHEDLVGTVGRDAEDLPEPEVDQPRDGDEV
jgi:hypothetical protein